MTENVFSGNCFKSLIGGFLVILLGCSSPVSSSDSSKSLPLPEGMVRTTSLCNPPILVGIEIDKNNPWRFSFILDTGDNRDLTKDQVKQKADELIEYFFAALTIPEEDLWVNLSPYESNRIIPDELGKTTLGKELLTQDYLLKQLMASLTYPEEEPGKTFWQNVHQEVYKKFGTTNIPISTFNKVWIKPEEIVVYEDGNKAFLTKPKLKVLLEADYLAMRRSKDYLRKGVDKKSEDAQSISAQITKEIILPEVEQEVNRNRSFTPIRQAVNSVILALWYKNHLKTALLNQIYTDQKKIAGVECSDSQIKEKVYEQYNLAYEKGVYNFIKRERNVGSHKPIRRKYYSGGATLACSERIEKKSTRSQGAAKAIGENVKGDPLKITGDGTPDVGGNIRGDISVRHGFVNAVRELIPDSDEQDERDLILKLLAATDENSDTHDPNLGIRRNLNRINALKGAFASVDNAWGHKNEVFMETADGKWQKVKVLDSADVEVIPLSLVGNSPLIQRLKETVIREDGLQTINIITDDGRVIIICFEVDLEELSEDDLYKEIFHDTVELHWRKRGYNWMFSHNMAVDESLKEGLITETQAKAQRIPEGTVRAYEQYLQHRAEKISPTETVYGLDLEFEAEIDYSMGDKTLEAIALRYFAAYGYEYDGKKYTKVMYDTVDPATGQQKTHTLFLEGEVANLSPTHFGRMWGLGIGSDKNEPTPSFPKGYNDTFLQIAIDNNDGSWGCLYLNYDRERGTFLPDPTGPTRLKYMMESMYFASSSHSFNATQLDNLPAGITDPAKRAEDVQGKDMGSALKDGSHGGIDLETKIKRKGSFDYNIYANQPLLLFPPSELKGINFTVHHTEEIESIPQHYSESF
ncbi:MAG: hypothetical protein GY858_00360 [Candidatus Omnitrophica bacterium]|nr:hypothetical protein [Candidatus Omnitrophota bacterium]